MLLEGLGLPQGSDATIPSRRAVELTRHYVGAFFDLQLKGVRQPLLDGPTATAPEVSFHS